MRGSPMSSRAARSGAIADRCPRLWVHTRVIPGGAARDRPEDRHPAVEPSRELARDAGRGAAGRSARLRPPLDVGPPLRHLRRPVPADLRGLDAARGVGDGDRADPPGPARRGQHVPQSGARRQDGHHARSRQRRSGHPGHRRRLDGARAHGPRHRVRDRVRPAAGLAGRVGRHDARGARRRVGRPRSPAATTSSTTCGTSRDPSSRTSRS